MKHPRQSVDLEISGVRFTVRGEWDAEGQSFYPDTVEVPESIINQWPAYEWNAFGDMLTDRAREQLIRHDEERDAMLKATHGLGEGYEEVCHG